VLQNLQILHVLQQGYVNLRCEWTFGCPDDVYLTESRIENARQDSRQIWQAYRDNFVSLFPERPIPDVIAQPCCAQFAVSREQIRQLPKHRYTQYRDWLMETELEDYVSGRILEFGWHMIFGREPVHCPNVQDCYCKTFGICNLECDRSRCKNRWRVPRSLDLPLGWPDVGWDGKTVII
jgi:hypothetical protein